MAQRKTRFDRIREFYGVPARRGQTVRDEAGHIGKITSSNGGHLRVCWQGEKRSWFYYHPCDLDYLDDNGQWQLGADYLERTNAKIDRFNRWLAGETRTPTS